MIRIKPPSDGSRIPDETGIEKDSSSSLNKIGELLLSIIDEGTVERLKYAKNLTEFNEILIDGWFQRSPLVKHLSPSHLNELKDSFLELFLENPHLKENVQNLYHVLTTSSKHHSDSP